VYYKLAIVNSRFNGKDFLLRFYNNFFFSYYYLSPFTFHSLFLSRVRQQNVDFVFIDKMSSTPNSTGGGGGGEKRKVNEISVSAFHEMERKLRAAEERASKEAARAAIAERERKVEAARAAKEAARAIAYEANVHLVFKEGVPALDYGHESSTNAGPSLDTNHSSAESIEKAFTAMDYVAENYNFETHFGSNAWKNVLQKTKIVASENDVASFCSDAFTDISVELKLGLQVGTEYHMYTIRPDLLLVTSKGRPCGVVEVKKRETRPDKTSAFNARPVVGELFDYMLLLRMSGVRRPFGILTTYDEWRAYWLPDSVTDAVMMSTESIAERCNALVAATSSDSPPPNTILPHKGEAFGEAEIPRTLHCSPILQSSAGVSTVKGIATVLTLMVKSVEDRTGILDVKAAPLHAIGQVARAEGYTWRHATAPLGLDFSRAPNANTTSFFMWKHLGRGSDGRCFLATPIPSSSTKGKLPVCAVKIYFESTKKVAAPAKPKTEVANWELVYGNSYGKCRLLRCCGHDALVMPYFELFPTPLDTRLARKSDIRNALLRHFVNKELIHEDLEKWDHVALDNDNNVVFLDLHSVKRETDANVRNEWLSRTMNALYPAPSALQH
jgi:hypothetical protein